MTELDMSSEAILRRARTRHAAAPKIQQLDLPPLPAGHPRSAELEAIRQDYDAIKPALIHAAAKIDAAEYLFLDKVEALDWVGADACENEIQIWARRFERINTLRWRMIGRFEAVIDSAPAQTVPDMPVTAPLQ